MAKHTDETKNAKLIITIVCIVALVILSLARLLNEEFKVDLIVYAIIGGILFGVGGIRELLGSIHFSPPSKDEDPPQRQNNRKRRR